MKHVYDLEEYVAEHVLDLPISHANIYRQFSVFSETRRNTECLMHALLSH